ncbi:MAG TPA: diguanylate cyclase, partial [Actinomycetota bacterium]|nr:diguanylate cyclase [Actinomycetota bacterium]
MGWQWSVYGVAMLAAACLMLTTLFIVWPRRRVEGGHSLVGLLAAMLLWTVAYACEAMVVGTPVKVFFGTLGYPGAMSVPVFFFLFCIEYTQSERWAPSPRWLVWIVPTLCVLAAATNGLHRELWTHFVLQPGNILVYEHGPAFVLVIGYSYLLLVLGILVLLSAFRRHDQSYRGQFIATLFFAVFPIMGSVAYVSGFSPFPGQDPAPIAFALTAAGLAWMLLRQGLLTVVPIAQDSVLQNLHDAVLVLDTAGRVAMANRAFFKWLGIHGRNLVGESAVEILEPWPPLRAAIDSELDNHEVFIDHPVGRHVDVRRTVVTDGRGRVRGRVLVMRDVNELRVTALQLRDANEQLNAQLVTIRSLEAGLREQALRDPLTGLYNRRYLEETIGRELARAGREQIPLSLMMIDLDHFKRVNDEHGHAAGDQVLRWLGDLLTAKLRPGDIACRYGGEEFVVIMPAAPLDIALERAEEIRTAFTPLVSAASGNRHSGVTLSAGLAVFPTHATTAGELRRCADVALYAAKRAGRNRVTVYKQRMTMEIGGV